MLLVTACQTGAKNLQNIKQSLTAKLLEKALFPWINALRYSEVGGSFQLGKVLLFLEIPTRHRHHAPPPKHSLTHCPVTVYPD